MILSNLQLAIIYSPVGGHGLKVQVYTYKTGSSYLDKPQAMESMQC